MNNSDQLTNDGSAGILIPAGSESDITVEDVVAVARHGALISGVSDKSREMIEASCHIVNEIVKENRKVYGVTTGFGSNRDCFLEKEEDVQQLQTNLILSHAVGVGDYLPTEAVRAIMFLRAVSLARGYSGVRLKLIDRLIEFLNKGIHPLIPEKGSVGSSGDLCPLAHMSLGLIGRGKVRFRDAQDGRDVEMSAEEALRNVGIDPQFTLSYKEGLALTNGANAITGIGTLACFDAANLLKAADISGTLTLEAVGGRSRAFDEKVQNVRRHSGQKDCAANIRRIFQGSGLIDKNGEVQDSYSVRCMPQVHGASRDAVSYVRRVLTDEINAATDNPLFFPNDAEPGPYDKDAESLEYSAGNFHGQPVALAMDFLGIAVSEIGNIAERRIQKLLDANHNKGLPGNLTPRPGLNSGFMIAQYTAAALVSENKILAHPASVDSIPTSSNIEDHVSMGNIAAVKARRIIENVRYIIAIELMCACQALDFRMGRVEIPSSNDNQEGCHHEALTFTGTPGRGSLAGYEAVRRVVGALEGDRELYEDIGKIKSIVQDGLLVKAVEDELG